MKKILAALFALFVASAAYAQNSGTVPAGAYVLGRGAGVTGYSSLLCSAGQLAVGQAGAPVCRTVSGDWTLNAAGVATLATVNAGVGTFGSATQCTVFTVNAKGLITAASQTTCTPSILSVTGLGTGVATALANNVGSAGAVVLFNGAGGTPTSLVLTNATGLPVGAITGLGANCGTFLATPSSANLRACLTDESGTGLAYFQGGDLGTPSAGVATNLTSLNATQLTTGTIPAARTNGHQNGTATNDSAAAGEIGEYVSAQLLISSATSVTAGAAKDITTMSLTAGDWDVWGVVIHIPAAGTVSQQLCAYTSSGAANTYAGNDSGQVGCIAFGAGVTGGSNSYAITPVARFSLSGTTTVRLGVLDSFTTSTMTAAGTLKARRMR
jgi:hypothetical protein